MEISIRQKDNAIILDLSGNIDVNAANFVETVGQCLRDGYTDILCNLEEVGMIDYMGLSVMVIAYKDAANHQGRIKFVNVPAHLKNLLAIAGLDKVIEVYASEEQALASFNKDKEIENIKRMQLRRRFKRLPIDIKVELKGSSGRSPACYQVDIFNLSAVGAFIHGCDKFRLGDEVWLKFKLPPFPREIELEGIVVWISDKQVQPHDHPGMGVEFKGIPPETQNRLIEFIERNAPTISTED